MLFLAEPSVSQRAAKINPEMICAARNSNHRGEVWFRKQLCGDISTPPDITTNVESKTTGLLSEPGRCETYLAS
jgi:hypothetical protein